MIVRERPSALKLFLIVRGSILPRIRTTLIVNTLIATLVTWCHGTLFDHKVILTTIPFTLIGLPLAIFLGFRNTAAYDRYWEGRKLWGAADKFNHRVNSDTGAKLGTVEQQPLALSAQYHFGQADNTFRPFVGVGYYESNFSNEDIPALDGLHVGVETAKGAIGTVGVDMNINPTWFVRADARYLHARPELTVGGQGSGSDLKLDPWVVGLGIGARF